MTALRAFREQTNPEAGHTSEDVQLVERCKKGDQVAWKELATRYEKLITATVRREMSRMGKLHAYEYEVPDLVQQVWLEITKSIDKWDGRGGSGVLAAWMTSIVQHRTIDWARSRFLVSKGGAKERWIKESSSDEEGVYEHVSASASPEDLAGRNELQERANHALSMLPEREQEAWKRGDMEASKLKQIGGRLGVSESRVSQIVSSAERKLADLLKEYREAA